MMAKFEIPPLNFINCIENLYSDCNGNQKSELIVTYRIPSFGTAVFQKFKEPFYLYLKEDRLKIRIPVIHATMKHYYERFSDYYYLPAEDLCIPKSIASGVDRARIEPAKKETCYMKYTGSFIPSLDTNELTFQWNLKDRFTYQIYRSESADEAFFQRAGTTILRYYEKELLRFLVEK